MRPYASAPFFPNGHPSTGLNDGADFLYLPILILTINMKMNANEIYELANAARARSRVHTERGYKAIFAIQDRRLPIGAQAYINGDLDSEHVLIGSFSQLFAVLRWSSMHLRGRVVAAPRSPQHEKAEPSKTGRVASGVSAMAALRMSRLWQAIKKTRKASSHAGFGSHGL